MEKILKGDNVVAKLENNFDIIIQLHKVQSQLSPITLTESHNLEFLAREKQAYEIQNKLQWEEIEKFSKLKYSAP